MVLTILIVCTSSIVVFANQYDLPTKEATEQSFSANYTRTYTKVQTSLDTAATRAKNTSDNGNYKVIYAGVFSEAGGSWSEVRSEVNCGTTTIVATNINTYGYGNLVAIGQMGNSTYSQAGTKETIVLNVRKSSSYNFVPEYYYY